MKNLLKIFGVMVLSLIMPYIILAFINWEFNPEKWSVVARFMMMMIWISCVIGSLYCVFVNLK